jgi:hypothetical protein
VEKLYGCRNSHWVKADRRMQFPFPAHYCGD